ncbi:unnamed protein product, partial [Discosporangium mesarthrocarpum]
DNEGETPVNGLNGGTQMGFSAEEEPRKLTRGGSVDGEPAGNHQGDHGTPWQKDGQQAGNSLSVQGDTGKREHGVHTREGRDMALMNIDEDFAPSDDTNGVMSSRWKR